MSSEGEQGHDRRHDAPDVEVIQRVHVGTDPAQQVAAAMRLQQGGSQGLDTPEEPDPDRGEDPQGRVVVDKALRVPPACPSERKGPNRRRGGRVVHERPGGARQRHRRDEPA